MDFSKFKTTLWEHQQRCLAFMWDKNNVGLFPTMGAGKSKMALDWIYLKAEADLIDSVLLFAPNGVDSQWHCEQIPLHYSGRARSIVFDGKAAGTKKYARKFDDFLASAEPGVLDFYIFSTSGLARGKLSPMFIEKVFGSGLRLALIVDEIVSCKTPKTATAKAMHSISQRPQVKCRAGLAGLQITETVMDLYSIMNIISPNFFPVSFTAFQSQYGIMVTKPNYNSGKCLHLPLTYEESKVLVWFFQKMYMHYLPNSPVNPNARLSFASISRRTGVSIADVAYLYKGWEGNKDKKDYILPRFKDLDNLLTKVSTVSVFVPETELTMPDVVEEDVLLDMGDQLRLQYRMLQKDLYLEYKDVVLDVKNRLTLALRLQQLSGGFLPRAQKTSLPVGGNKKLEFLLSDIVGIQKRDKILVWARFTDEIKLLYQSLNALLPCEVGKYYGEMDAEERDETMSRFLKVGSKLRVLVINPAVGAVGLNLQVANWNYLYSSDFSVFKYEQQIKRTARSGQKKTVFFKKLVYVDSIDEKVYEAIQRKQDLIHYVNSFELLRHKEVN